MLLDGVVIEEGVFEEVMICCHPHCTCYCPDSALMFSLCWQHNIEQGAKLSVQQPDANLWARLRDVSHATSDLHEALIARDFNAAHRALDNGASPTAVYRWRDPRRSFLDSGRWTQRGECRELGDIEEMQCPALCLALGARDRVDVAGGLPRNRQTRHVGEEPGLVQLVERLLELGADPNGSGNELDEEGSGGYFNNRHDLVPLQLAQQRGGRGLAAVLERAGAC